MLISCACGGILEILFPTIAAVIAWVWLRLRAFRIR